MDLHYSQTTIADKPRKNGFTTLWIYTILKLPLSSGLDCNCFTTLWIYTILKPIHGRNTAKSGFTTLWIYTILKLTAVLLILKLVSLPYGFTLFSNADLPP